MITFVTFYLLRTQQAAGGEDILTTTGSDGGKHTMGRQIIAQGFHTLLVRARQVDTRDLMESDQVHKSVQSLHQFHDLTTKSGRIVQSAKADILERTTALV